MVVLATRKVGDELQILVAPVTHSPPERAADAVEMPANVKLDLGLDREKSWIVVSELNQFIWQGPDVRLLDNGSPFYGAIPDWLYVPVRGAIGALAQKGRLKVTKRTE